MHVITVVPIALMSAGDTGAYDRHIISAVQQATLIIAEGRGDTKNVDFVAVTCHFEHH